MSHGASNMSRRENIRATISDAVSDLLYYDRKGDESLPVGAIDEAVRQGEISIAEMVALFERELREGLQP